MKYWRVERSILEITPSLMHNAHAFISLWGDEIGFFKSHLSRCGKFSPCGFRLLFNFGNLKFIGYFWTWQCSHELSELVVCGLLKFNFFRFTTSTEHTSVSRNLARQQARHKQRSRRQRKIPAHLQVTKPILLRFEYNVQSSRNRSNVCVEKWYNADLLFCRAALTLCLP